MTLVQMRPSKKALIFLADRFSREHFAVNLDSDTSIRKIAYEHSLNRYRRTDCDRAKHEFLPKGNYQTNTRREFILSSNIA